ncbi:uncharacterized protein N7458_002481 [Penicillium daleae]|uniref:Uncharacterized protein n=1 Tax=Penicillium daleae TaxID=63821 RepID=A0AAD6G5X6_9EURO|nr:uncharacterized protein N7458_002481 [Penicillium daleae]KAJ5460929.1 hypothetical protein N7458_002481 [Penicillium daleae]
MQEIGTSSRIAFTKSIDHNEEYIDSLISKVDNDSSSRKSRRQCKRNPVTNQLLGFTDASSFATKTASGRTKEEKKAADSTAFKKRADEPSLGRTAAEGTIEEGCQCSNQEPLPGDDHVKGSRPLNLPANDFSSYQPDTSFTMKAMASILFECFVVNLGISRYGHRTSMGPTTTDPDKIRKYVDEIAEYSKGLQHRHNETIFWKIILKGAALIDHTKLPSAKGPADGFTVAEKAATRKFMEDAGYGLSAQNQRHCRNFWKNLFKMREVRIEKSLYYRTKEFDSYCKGYPKTSEISLVDAILKWQTEYRPHIEQLETRALRLGKGDYARLCDLENPQVVERLKVRESNPRVHGVQVSFSCSPLSPF